MTSKVAKMPVSDADEKWQLRLYTAGQTPKSLAAMRNLKKVCEEHLAGRYEIEVVDLMKNPRLAKDHPTVAIPTLVRKLPTRSARSSAPSPTRSAAWSACS